MKVGDRVKIKHGISDASIKLHGQTATIKAASNGATRPYYVLDNGFSLWAEEVELIEPKGVYMFKQVGSDLKSFITDNKSVIYWVATMFLIDHLLLQGAFRERLHGLMNKMLGKAEAAMDKDMTLSVVEKKA